MKKFWFFDLDGTLADTDADIRVSWKAALQDLGLNCPCFDERFVAGPPIEESLKRLLPECYTDELAERLRERFGSHYDHDGFPHTAEYPGVLDVIRTLKARGAHVFIVSNKRFVGATAMARHFGWDRVFDGIYCGDMYVGTPVGKLRKDALLGHVMRLNGAPSDDSVMVGDTGNDFAAALANGIVSVAVEWGYGTESERSAADCRVKSPDGLLTLAYAAV